MLNREVMEGHLEKLGFGDFNFTDEVTGDDFIKVLLPELDFRMVAQAVNGSHLYRRGVVDFTEDSYKIQFNEVLLGYKCICELTLHKDGVGTRFTFRILKIEYYDSIGVYTPCIGFGMLRALIERDSFRKDELGI